jgi:hypothetical protein
MGDNLIVLRLASGSEGPVEAVQAQGTHGGDRFQVGIEGRAERSSSKRTGYARCALGSSTEVAMNRVRGPDCGSG